nr:MAG TPA: hypothetical protein [Caudoviricetes sp.]
MADAIKHPLFLVQKIFIKIEISTCFYIVNDV